MSDNRLIRRKSHLSVHGQDMERPPGVQNPQTATARQCYTKQLSNERGDLKAKMKVCLGCKPNVPPKEEI